MAQFAALLFLPTNRHAHEDTDALQTTASILAQSLDDVRLAEHIQRALHAKGYSALRDIEVFVSDRIVHLVGRVPTYYLKQIAQQTALAVPGIHQVHNEVDVIH